MSKLLTYILEAKRSIPQIRKKINPEYPQIPLFKKFKRLNNSSLSEHLKENNKIKYLTLEDLHEAGAIDIEEKNKQGYTLLQSGIQSNNLDDVRKLLSMGAVLAKEDLKLAADAEIKVFLKYRPGTKQPSILEFCSKRRRDNYLEKLDALLFDQENSSGEESSDAESFSSESLDETDTRRLERFRTKHLKVYNDSSEDGSDDSPLCLVAARGVHFTPKYFKKREGDLEQVKNNRHAPHTTYSQSTLFDAGYKANNSVSESDEDIAERHEYNRNFIEQLKETDDFKEKKTKKHTPPATRNKKEFDSAYERFMQIYINSYSTLFSKKTIKTDFGFDTLKNPLVSASWVIEKGAMYGNGARIEQSKRRDPHYRRFTGKPKHPNMGYIDLFVLDVEYVRNNGFDRALQCAANKIDLNSMYRHEAEIIFNSMIPKEFHQRRCILSVPSFDKPYAQNKAYYAHYGIKSEKTFDALKEKLNTPKNSEEYKKNITTIFEKAAEGQASSIKKTLDYRLFKAKKPKAVVYDHGDTLESAPFKI